MEPRIELRLFKCDRAPNLALLRRQAARQVMTLGQNFIRTTKTKTGLKVNARLVKKQYAKGIKISDPAMTVLNFKRPTSLPKWNYTLRPSKNGK